MKDIRIVVASYGWVFVGEYSAEGSAVKLTRASVVRVWGTDKGLGQLALSGPTPNTILDPCGVVEIPTASVVASIAVRSDWL